MKTNTGAVDRVVRVMIGLVLLALTVAGPHMLWGLLGLIPLATGAVGFCPLYALFGWSTERAAEEHIRLT